MNKMKPTRLFEFIEFQKDNVPLEKAFSTKNKGKWESLSSIDFHEKSKAIKFLELLSGRRHKVSTAFNVYCKDKIDSLRVVTSIVKMKRLTEDEIKFYIESNEWKGKAGVYGIQGSAEKFIQFISGSYSNIVGLPLNQVYGSLNSIGYSNEK